ncbi:hypothetical protein BGX30_008356 [Mortierella sp. GBA39]|nr:hypothetical protein BGX30_008356 [Mortierella sp. GBA39]
MQIRQMLKNDIQQGRYKPDEQIPTEAELCDIYSVSRITIRKAIEELVREGALTRIPRRGTFVASNKFHNELLSKKITTNESTYKILSEDYGTEIVSNDKEIDVIGATKEYAKLLECDIGANLFRILKVAFDAKDEPVHLSTFMCETNRVTLTVHRAKQGQ